MPDSLRSFAAAAYLVNLYDDEVDILGQRFIGPTHAQALEQCIFELTDEKEIDGETVYYIAVSSRNSAPASLRGYVVIVEREYAMIEAQLRPDRRVYHERIESESGLSFFCGRPSNALSQAYGCAPNATMRLTARRGRRPSSNRCAACAVWRHLGLACRGGRG